MFHKAVTSIWQQPIVPIQVALGISVTQEEMTQLSKPQTLELSTSTSALQICEYGGRAPVFDGKVHHYSPRAAMSFTPTPVFLAPVSPSTFFGTSVSTALPAAKCRRHVLPTCTAKPDADGKRRRLRPKRRASAFQNTLDDLTMKRLGRGTIYYGERASSADGDEDEADEDEEYLLKPDPVVVAGGTGRTGQWIALGLMNQGFNVRCFTRAFDRAEKLFGPSGSNLDVFEGDLGSVEDVYQAIDGSIAIVCAAGAPWWLPGGFDAVDVRGVQNLVDAAKRAGTVKRFVLISAAMGDSPRGRSKRRAEEVVRESGLPFVIMRAPELRDTEGGLKKIALSVGEKRIRSGANISRIDLAQCVCQTLVYDRSIQQLNEKDPDGEFDFPNCVVTVENEEEPYVPDKRFWKREFNRISDAYREKTDVADVENVSAT